MGIRTPDLLHAIQWQHVHPRPSPQVTVSGRPHQSSGIQAGCCTFVLYRSRATRRLHQWPVQPELLAMAAQHHMLSFEDRE